MRVSAVQIPPQILDQPGHGLRQRRHVDFVQFGQELLRRVLSLGERARH